MTTRAEAIAAKVLAAAVVAEPIAPLSWATATDEQGRPLYLVCYVMGQENIDQFNVALKQLQPHMKPVEPWLVDAISGDGE